MNTRRHSAFTLIELLVVVAIIAVLISILLPSLAQAREQGKRAVCLTNLRQMGTAQGQYQNEFADAFPHHYSPESRNYGGMGLINGFYYGGKWAWTQEAGFFYAKPGPHLKPFNRYMYKDIDGKLVEADKDKPELRAMEMLIYKCPSDFGGQYITDPNGEPDAFITLYDFAGSSYDQNYHASLGVGPFQGKKINFWDTPATGMPNADNNVSTNDFWKRKLLKEPGRFITIWEDSFDVAVWNGIQTRGFHKRFSTHSVLFLDGHAENRLFDTRQNWGSGWNTASRYWMPWGEYGQK